MSKTKGLSVFFISSQIIFALLCSISLGIFLPMIMWPNLVERILGNQANTDLSALLVAGVYLVVILSIALLLVFKTKFKVCGVVLIACSMLMSLYAALSTLILKGS